MEAVAYAKGTLNEIDSEIAASHLEGCEACAVRSSGTRVSRHRDGSGLAIRGWQPVRIAAAVMLAAAFVLFVDLVVAHSAC